MGKQRGHSLAAAQPHQPFIFRQEARLHCVVPSFNISSTEMVNLSASRASQDAEVEQEDDPTAAYDWDWLRHSLAIDHLWRPAVAHAEFREHGVSCGPLAFAALTRLHWQAALLFFPDVSTKSWTNRTAMERALRTIGYDYVRNPSVWPSVGLCLLHFTGPWTRRGYPAAVLQNTHWIAVQEDYVFDVNWNGWLPRQNWEEVVVDELLQNKELADGWIVMTSYEIANASDLAMAAAIHIATATPPAEVRSAPFAAQR